MVLNSLGILRALSQTGANPLSVRSRAWETSTSVRVAIRLSGKDTYNPRLNSSKGTTDEDPQQEVDQIPSKAKGATNKKIIITVPTS